MAAALDVCRQRAGVNDNAPWVLRLWSTGLVEIRRIESQPTACWCQEAWPPPFTWIDFGTPAPPTPDAKPVDLDFGDSGNLLVAYSDGTVYRTIFDVILVEPCNGEPTTHCELEAPVWEIVP